MTKIPTPDICIYHGYCPDGFTAAWVVWKRFGDAVEYRHGSYGSAPPTADGKHILLVDFSYDRDTMVELYHKAASVTVLDHHKTAEAYIGPMIESGHVGGCFDMDRSGAGLTWDVLNPGIARPALVDFIEDRDLWRWRFGDNTRFFCMWLDTHEMTFAEWDKAYAFSSSHLLDTYDIGEILFKKHIKNCEHLIAATLHHIQIGEHRVPCCNVPHIYCSEVGNMLAKREDAPFSATFFVNKTGDYAFSLRSLDEKEDVSRIAVSLGGGGHRNAAGFKLPANQYFPIVE